MLVQCFKLRFRNVVHWLHYVLFVDVYIVCWDEKKRMVFFFLFFKEKGEQYCGRCWNWVKSLSVCTNRDCRKVLCKQTNKTLKWTNTFRCGMLRLHCNSKVLKENIQKVFHEQYIASSGWTHFASQAQLIVFLHLLLLFLFSAIRSQLDFFFRCRCNKCAYPWNVPIKKKKEPSSFTNNWCS